MDHLESIVASKTKWYGDPSNIDRLNGTVVNKSVFKRLLYTKWYDYYVQNLAKSIVSNELGQFSDQTDGSVRFTETMKMKWYDDLPRDPYIDYDGPYSMYNACISDMDVPVVVKKHVHSPVREFPSIDIDEDDSAYNPDRSYIEEDSMDMTFGDDSYVSERVAPHPDLTTQYKFADEDFPYQVLKSWKFSPRLIHEHSVGCIVNELRKECPNFVYTYGRFFDRRELPTSFIVYEHIPNCVTLEEFVSVLGKGVYLYEKRVTRGEFELSDDDDIARFQNIANLNFDDVRDASDLRSMLLGILRNVLSQIVCALRLAQIKIGFVHNNLTWKNVWVRTHDDKIHTTYKLSDEVVKVVSRHTAHITDFSRARVRTRIGTRQIHLVPLSKDLSVSAESEYSTNNYEEYNPDNDLYKLFLQPLQTGEHDDELRRVLFAGAIEEAFNTTRSRTFKDILGRLRNKVSLFSREMFFDPASLSPSSAFAASIKESVEKDSGQNIVIRAGDDIYTINNARDIPHIDKFEEGSLTPWFKLVLESYVSPYSHPEAAATNVRRVVEDDEMTNDTSLDDYSEHVLPVHGNIGNGDVGDGNVGGGGARDIDLTLSMFKDALTVVDLVVSPSESRRIEMVGSSVDEETSVRVITIPSGEPIYVDTCARTVEVDTFADNVFFKYMYSNRHVYEERADITDLYLYSSMCCGDNMRIAFKTTRHMKFIAMNSISNIVAIKNVIAHDINNPQRRIEMLRDLVGLMGLDETVIDNATGLIDKCSPPLFDEKHYINLIEGIGETYANQELDFVSRELCVRKGLGRFVSRIARDLGYDGFVTRSGAYKIHLCDNTSHGLKDVIRNTDIFEPLPARWFTNALSDVVVEHKLGELHKLETFESDLSEKYRNMITELGVLYFLVMQGTDPYIRDLPIVRRGEHSRTVRDLIAHVVRENTSSTRTVRTNDTDDELLRIVHQHIRDVKSFGGIRATSSIYTPERMAIFGTQTPPSVYEYDYMHSVLDMFKVQCINVSASFFRQAVDREDRSVSTKRIVYFTDVYENEYNQSFCDKAYGNFTQDFIHGGFSALIETSDETMARYVSLVGSSGVFRNLRHTTFKSPGSVNYSMGYINDKYGPTNQRTRSIEGSVRVKINVRKRYDPRTKSYVEEKEEYTMDADSFSGMHGFVIGFGNTVNQRQSIIPLYVEDSGTSELLDYISTRGVYINDTNNPLDISSEPFYSINGILFPASSFDQ